MPETVAILGATGVYARHLMPRLTADGYRVRALVRRPETAHVARACGAEVVAADIFDTDSMRRALEGCQVSVHLATSLPGPRGGGDFAANDRLRTEGTPNWVAACTEAGIERAVLQSIGMVHSSGEQWADEDSVYRPSEHDGDGIAARAIDAALEMEQAVNGSDLDWLVLRGGLFYGPGTGLDEGWHERAAQGRLRLPGDGSDHVSLVHITDMANATHLALRHWPSRQALIVCDDEPATWREILQFVAACHGQASPVEGGFQGFPSFRLRNGRAKQALAWQPTVPSWRLGLIR